MDEYDLCIVGGGLACLTLALQLRRTDQGLRVLVAERQPRPAPEAAYKVGESVADVGSRYLDTVLGLGDSLDQEQLPKLMLRFFLPAGDNADIARRVELAPAASYLSGPTSWIAAGSRTGWRCSGRSRS